MMRVCAIVPFLTTAVLFLTTAVLFLTTALSCGPSFESPCDTDPTGCSQSTSEFVIDPTCTLTGGLKVAVGTGATTFTPLTDTTWLDWGSGAQGGFHSWVSARITGADLTRYDRLKLEITIKYDDLAVGHRTLLLGKSQPLVEDSNGRIEVLGVVVFVDSPPGDTIRAVTATVTDPCARSGQAEHVSPAP